MLKIFFHRSSIVPKLIELTGFGLMIRMVYSTATDRASFPPVFGLLFLFYLFLRGCSVKRWYKEAPRDSGIELHFKKIIAPASYLLTLSIGAYLFFQQIWVSWISMPILLFLAIVNTILIYLHFQDKTGTPINSLTRTSC